MTEHGTPITQTFPHPWALEDLVAVTQYRDWHVALSGADYDRGQGSRGLTLIVSARVSDTYHPEERIIVRHLFPVPPAAYDRRSWQRWLFDRLGDVDAHERCEMFLVGGERPYAPSHAPGNDPYLIREIGTEADQKTDFRGVLHD